MKSNTITDWLMQPGKLSDTDRKEAAMLIKTYPYFVPTRYVEASEHQKKQAFAPAMLNMMQLYMGNWVLFHDYLDAATNKRATLNTPSSGRISSTDEVTGLPGYTDELYEEFSDEPDLYDFDDLPLPVEVQEVDEKTTVEESEILSGILDTDPEQNAGDTEITSPLAEAIPITTEAANKDVQPDTRVTPEPVTEAPVELQEPKPQTKAGATTGTSAQEPKPEKKKEEIPLFFQNRKEDSLIQPIYTEDYFLHQGLHVSDKLSGDHQSKKPDQSLMVVMSFSEWLMHFKLKGEREKEEQQDQKALKTMWQKEKLAAALEEENEEIPETVFEMAVNSITKEEDLASEPLAEIMVKQGKLDKAIEMYRKLSLRNPQKKSYFARKIEDLQKEKES